MSHTAKHFIYNSASRKVLWYLVSSATLLDLLIIPVHWLVIEKLRRDDPSVRRLNSSSGAYNSGICLNYLSSKTPPHTSSRHVLLSKSLLICWLSWIISWPPWFQSYLGLMLSLLAALQDSKSYYLVNLFLAYNCRIFVWFRLKPQEQVFPHKQVIQLAIAVQYITSVNMSEGALDRPAY